MRRVKRFILILAACLGAAFPVSSQETYWIETLAGNGNEAYTGDGGDPLLASLNSPRNVLRVTADSYYIADTDNHVIRYVTGTTITTVVGTGVAGVTLGTTKGTEAPLRNPRGMALDSNGNLIFADSGNHVIWRLRSDGFIEPVAGQPGIPGSSGDGAAATLATLRQPADLAVNAGGTIYISDRGNSRIRAIATDGVIRNFAGNGLFRYDGNGQIATQTALEAPEGIAVDTDGRVYIADVLNHLIRVVDLDGRLINVAGIPETPGASAEDVNALSAALNFPRDVAVSSDGTIYISDTSNHRIREIVDGTIRTIAGTGAPGFEVDRGFADVSTMNEPYGLDLSQINGFFDLFIADRENHRIRVVTTRDVFATPTPTPTSTPTPTNTYTPTATYTATNTPTATPTPLPGGQLAPELGPLSNTTGVYYQHTTNIYVPEDPQNNEIQIVLTSVKDGFGSISVTTKADLFVTGPSGTVRSKTFDFSGQNTTLPAQDVTSLFEQGSNNVQINLTNGATNPAANTALYIAMFSKPVFEDPPDIRYILGEKPIVAFNLQDYVHDPDTAFNNLVFSASPATLATIELNGDILFEPDGQPSVRSVVLSASDGVFNTTQTIAVKTSTFLFEPFRLADIPLVEDLAFITPDTLRDSVMPEGEAILDVPLSATFAASLGLEAVQNSRGHLYFFSSFPGSGIDQAFPVSVLGHRFENEDDLDGVAVYTAHAKPPIDGDVELDFNFDAETLDDSTWFYGRPSRDFTLAQPSIRDDLPISPDSPLHTDGRGLYVEVDPGEGVTLLTPNIITGKDTIVMSVHLAVDNPNFSTELPSITIALIADQSNLSYTSIVGDAIAGFGTWQEVTTVYDTNKEENYALIQIAGTHTVGTAKVYLDNVRIYKGEHLADRTIGNSELDMNWDGTFESVTSDLGDNVFPEISSPEEGEAYIVQNLTHTRTPGGKSQSLVIKLNDPLGVARVNAGPITFPNGLLPSDIGVRAYVYVMEPGEGFFTLAISDGMHTAVTFISNDTLPENQWTPITVGMNFRQTASSTPLIVMQNAALPGAAPGVVKDAAVIAIDDVRLLAPQDTFRYWRKELLRLGDDGSPEPPPDDFE